MLLKVSLVVIGLLIVGGIWWGYQNSSKLVKPASNEVATQKYTGPAEKIRIGNFVGEYSILNRIATDNGYLKENGIDAETQEYDTGPGSVAALLEGKVDVTVSSDFTGMRNFSAHPNLRIVTQVSKQEVFQLVARKDKGINTPADLKGKKVGVTRKGVGEYFLGQFLTSNNLQLQDVKVIDLSTADIVKQFESGEIDVAVIFDPKAYDLKKKMGDNTVAWSVHQNDQQIFAILYSTDEFIKAHPDLIKRYLRALSKAEEYIKNNQAEAKAYYVKNFKYDNDYVEYIWSKIHIGLNLEQSLLLSMEEETRWSIANKLIDNSTVPNYLDYIYLDGLQSIKPEAVTIIH